MGHNLFVFNSNWKDFWNENNLFKIPAIENLAKFWVKFMKTLSKICGNFSFFQENYSTFHLFQEHFVPAISVSHTHEIRIMCVYNFWDIWNFD